MREDLLVVPVLLVVLERAVERREAAVGDGLRDRLVVPVAWAGVDALGDEGAKVDGVVVVAAAGGGAVAHGGERAGG